jgi:hypothetical protein
VRDEGKRIDSPRREHGGAGVGAKSAPVTPMLPAVFGKTTEKTPEKLIVIGAA